MAYDGWDKLSTPPSLDSEDHHCLFSNNKIWLISQTYHPITKFNWGHRIMNNGGYTVFYDLATSKWSETQNFNKLVDDEGIEELVFTYKGKICVLLFENFGQIKFHQLAVFDETENQFTMWNEYENEQINIKSDEPQSRNHLILADGDLPDGSKLLVASVDGTLHIFKLTIDFESKKSTIERTSTHVFDIMLIPIHAAAQGPFVIVEYSNRAACCVNWDPTTHFRFHIEQSSKDEAEQKTEIKGDPPRFAFTGAKLLSLLDNNRWLHVAGFSQKGMADHEFRGDIWLLEFPFSNEPKWKKLEENLPDEVENSYLAFDKKTNSLYVVDKANGIFKKKIEL